MYCRNCGVQNPDNAKFCIDCGEKLDASQTVNQNANTYQSQTQYPYPPQSQPQYQQSYQQPYYSPYYQQDSFMQQMFANRAANTSLTCGIIGLFVAGIILGIVAVVQSNKAKNMGYIGGKATAGLVLGIIDIIFGAIVSIAFLGSMSY